MAGNEAALMRMARAKIKWNENFTWEAVVAVVEDNLHEC